MKLKMFIDLFFMLRFNSIFITLYTHYIHNYKIKIKFKHIYNFAVEYIYEIS